MSDHPLAVSLIVLVGVLVATWEAPPPVPCDTFPPRAHPYAYSHPDDGTRCGRLCQHRCPPGMFAVYYESACHPLRYGRWCVVAL